MQADDQVFVGTPLDEWTCQRYYIHGCLGGDVYPLSLSDNGQVLCMPLVTCQNWRFTYPPLGRVFGLLSKKRVKSL